MACCLALRRQMFVLGLAPTYRMRRIRSLIRGLFHCSSQCMLVCGCILKPAWSDSQVAQLVPESELYSNMLAVDRQVTSAINYKKARIREALQRPLRVPKRLRVIISSVPEHQNLPRFTPGAPGDDQLRGEIMRSLIFGDLQCRCKPWEKVILIQVLASQPLVLLQWHLS